MNAVAVIGLAAAVLWLGFLTIALAAVVRQVALMSFQLQRSSGAATANDGLPIGSFAPSELLIHIPEADGKIAYVLLTSAVCAPCREVVSELERLAPIERVVALVPGRPEVADSLVLMFPDWIRVVRDPAATNVASSLQIASTPFALEIDDGQITGKVFMHEAEDLVRLASAREAKKRPPALPHHEEVLVDAS